MGNSRNYIKADEKLTKLQEALTTTSRVAYCLEKPMGLLPRSPAFTAQIQRSAVLLKDKATKV